MNHLYAMSAPGDTCSGLSWSYDQWGNRTAQNVTGGTCGSAQFTFNTSNHAINPGFQYDAAGNLVSDGVHSYTYDAENRLTAVDGGGTASYAYDAAGNRLEKVAGGAKTDYIYDAANRVMMEVNQSLAWQAGYVYLGGQLVAEYENGTTYFVHGDHLGSTRLLTNISGGVVDSMDYLPFGEQIAGAGTTTHKFTGYERDAESNLDNAQARYYGSPLGRFMSPDPIGNFVADPTNPQTWNMYVYVNNNPLSMIDPLGLDGMDWYDCMGSGNDPILCGTPPILSYSNSPICWGSSCDPTWTWPDPPTWTWPNPPTSAPPTSGGGGGPSIGPAAPQQKGCIVLDPISSGLEYTGKLGPEVQIGPIKAGFSFYKNFTTGQGGGEGELNLFVLSIEYNVPTPPGGSLTGNQPGEFSVSLVGFQKNFTTGQPWTFSPSKVWKLGLQGLAGAEASLNSTTMNQQAKANEACIAKGGG